MTPHEIRDSEVKGFIRKQKELGGIVPSKLFTNTKLLIETEKHIFQITVQKKTTGLNHFIVDSTFKGVSHYREIFQVDAFDTTLRHKMEDWIGFGMTMQLHLYGGRVTRTAPVVGVTVGGVTDMGENYKYEVWE